MRSSIDVEFLQLAAQVAQNSNCVRRHVGCVVVKEGSVSATGWNGVHTSPEFDCVAAGCPRCRVADTVTGIGYDRCLCIHAEQVAIANAARSGVPLEGATLYNTLRPCLNCAASALAAGIERVIYEVEWRYGDEELENAHARLRAQFTEFAYIAEAASATQSRL